MNIVMSNLGLAYLNQGKYGEAESLFRLALSTYEKTKSDSWQRYNCQSLLGVTLEREGKYSEAEPFLLSGYRGMVERKVSISAQNQILLDNAGDSVSRLYQDWGQTEKAAAWRETISRR
jgi:tetratricopeptide (TPR) repeat protein